MADIAKKTLEHCGQQYEIDKIYDLVDSGMKEKVAILTLYPTVPNASIANLVLKVKKHPYYLARKDVSLAIINEKGPELQQNLIDIALEGRSERNRLDATINALDRVYGSTKDEPVAPPTMVFNFSFNNNKAPAREIIEGVVADGDDI